MTDIVGKLRKVSANEIYLAGVPGTIPANVLANGAADEIERLRGVIHRSMKRTLPDTIDDLAAIIRKVDGSNSLGAAALAEAIIAAHNWEAD